MQLNVFATELESFWENQNQKLLAHPDFQSDNCNIFDDKFSFSKNYDAFSHLDFSVFDLPHIKLEQVASLSLKEKVYPLSLKEYAKLAVLNGISPKNAKGALERYKMLMHISAFLVSQQSLLLTAGNIEDFHIFFLTQSVNIKGFSSRLAPPSYAGSYRYANFSKLCNTLKLIGVTGILDNSLTKKRIYSTLDNACQSMLSIGLNEYKQGGSFNFLGLEMGQYYIDHMRQVYEQDYFYTLVCRKALEVVDVQFFLHEIKDSSLKGHWTEVCLDTIQGTYTANRYKVHINHHGDHLITSMEITQ
jgi:hypothetical protein